nr:VOC family protein [Neobacillus sp. Marseille-Q6967]
MKLEFDHLVWFYKHPEKAIIPLREKGIHVVKGGRHETWGTYNSLSYFGLSYIEFLGIENLAIAEQHEENRLVTQIVQQLAKENRDGPSKIAIRTDKIQELAQRFQEEGLAVYGPLPGKRVRADGVEIRWSLLFIERDSIELSLPFFIQWEKSDEERLLELSEQGFVGSHTVGNPELESVGFVVHDLKDTVGFWSLLLDLTPGEEFIDSGLNARCCKLSLPGTNLLFCTPLGEGVASKVLNKRGETPFLVNLTGTNQNRIFEMMNGYWRLR